MNMHRIRSFIAIALTLAVGTPACGSGDASTGTTSTSAPPTHSTAADDVILQMDAGGGLVPIEYLLTDLPEFSLYGDGRVVVPDPQIEIYPPPAIPAVNEFHISPDGIAAAVQRAIGSGVTDPLDDYGYPPVADAPTTTFTLDVGGITHRTSVYALGFDDRDEGMTMQQRDARLNLGLLAHDLTDPMGFLADYVVAPEQRYQFDQLGVVVLPGAVPDPTFSNETIAWPLEDLATSAAPSTANPTMSVLIVSGDDLATVLTLFEQANTLTMWASGDETYRLLLRPLLPDETELGGLSR